MKIKYRISERTSLALVSLVIALVSLYAVLVTAKQLFRCQPVPLSNTVFVIGGLVVSVFMAAAIILMVSVVKAFRALPNLPPLLAPGAASTPGPLPITDLDIEMATRAFLSMSLPVNPIPFARAIEAAVKKNGHDWIKSDDAKAVLWILNVMAYKQFFTLDASDEFCRLKTVFNARDQQTLVSEGE